MFEARGPVALRLPGTEGPVAGRGLPCAFRDRRLGIGAGGSSIVAAERPEPTRPSAAVGASHSSSERDTLLTADDLAKRWQMPTTDQVYRLAREGKLPSIHLGRYVRFRVDQIEEFEATGGTADG